MSKQSGAEEINSLNQSEDNASVGEEGGIVKECPKSSIIPNMRSEELPKLEPVEKKREEEKNHNSEGHAAISAISHSHSSDWSDIDDSDLSERIGVINSFPVEEEKKGEFPNDEMIRNEARPEWMRFLIEQLEFRPQKVNYLAE